MSITCTRVHTISCGHRVVGHEGKCANFHGHNYTLHITCRPADTPNTLQRIAQAGTLDAVGRVIDFSEIKRICCEWLEEAWDHKFLMWEKDPWYDCAVLFNIGRGSVEGNLGALMPGIVAVPFNPTAENMAEFLVVKFNDLFRTADKPIECSHVRVEETPKCWADAELIRLA